MYKIVIAVLLTFAFYLFVFSLLPQTSMTSALAITRQQADFDCTTVTEISRAECGALVDVFTGTDGTNWGINTGWLSTNTPCSWFGVTCAAGSVTILDLSNNQLVGFFPGQIGNLSNLAELRLQGNELAGSIPNALGALPKLEVLYLADNMLTDEIPPELGSLTNLRWLLLNNNNLSGAIPPELGSLQNLEILGLTQNSLIRSIPPELGNLAQLTSLVLTNNNLTGTIPSELGNLTNLEALYLNDNRLEGAIPSTLGDLTTLRTLWLQSNQLVDEIPTRLTNLSDLAECLLGYNSLVATDSSLLPFLNDRCVNWADTQTIPPTDVEVNFLTSSSVQVTWAPIAYVDDEGGYQVSVATASGGPYTSTGMVVNKANSAFTVTELVPGTTYNFVVQAYTPTHPNNKSSLLSANSDEVRISPTDDPFEPNDTCSQANTIDTNRERQRHRFHHEEDADWVTFDANAGQRYIIEVTSPITSTADIGIEVHRSCTDGSDEHPDPNLGPGVQIEVNAQSSGPIYLKLFNNPGAESGELATYDLSIRVLPTEAQRGVLILVGGSIRPNDSVQPNIYHVTDAVRQLFINQGYTDEQIFYLAADPSSPDLKTPINLIDANATAENLEFAITKWASQTIVEGSALTIYLMDHGARERIYLDKQEQEWATPADLDAWLSRFEEAHPNSPVNVFIEACYAGSFVSEPGKIARTGRVVIASTSDESLAWTSPHGAQFSDHFIASLARKSNLANSFQVAQSAAMAFHPSQAAWLDANGDGSPNDSDDYDIAAQRGFGVAGTLSDEWPPHIREAMGPDSVENGVGMLQVQVEDDVAVQQVWATIYPPSYSPPSDSEALVRDQDSQSITTIEMESDGRDGWYSKTYTEFDEQGLYRIVFYAQDNDNLVAQPLATEVAVGPILQTFLPFLAR